MHDETPNLASRLASDDRLTALKALREALSERLASPKGEDSLSMMASAAKELREIGEQIALLIPADGEESKIDELARRRAAAGGEPGTVAPVSASRRGESRRSGRRVGAG